MDNELSSIGDTISHYIIKFIIDDNYEINYELEWTEVIQDFIMRYRRIIGVIILIILIAIMRNCKFNNLRLQGEANNTKNNKIWVGKGGAGVALTALGSGGVASAASGLGTAVAGSGGAVAGSGGAAAAATAGQTVAANAMQNVAKDAMSNAKSGNSKNKLMDMATGGKYSEMRSAGMSKFGSGLELTRQGGQFVADKFKEFASWLYEILFAIAISIAICMIVVPSIAFFALGLICYFLLRKKLITMKAF